MNIYENIKKNLKESNKEELVNSLINYLYDTYGDNFKLEDNVNGYTKNEEIYETLVTQYLEEKPDISFVEWVKDIIADPHGLLEVKSLNEAENNNAAYVICYGTLEIWPDRDSAREYYEEGIAMSDGAEQQRYGNIAFALYKGNNFGDDDGPEMVTKIVDKNADGSDKSAGTKCGKMTHEQAFNYITKLQGSINESEAPQTYERGNAPFESKRVPEDRIREEGYQYFSTHGLGPGTHPRDVRVRELDIELPGGWVTFKTDRPLTSEELDWYDIQPETKNNYYRQRFHLEESEDSKEKIPNDLKVETCVAEQTGGWVWVAYGKMADGRYYCLFAEGVSFFDDDIHKYEYEEDHWDETQGDFSDWEDEHRIKTDPNKYYTYWYTDPEYLVMLKQCISLDPNAEYIADEDELTQMGIDKLYEESEDEKYEDPNYSIDTSNLVLTNGGYHNNAESIYGRVRLLPKNSKDYVKTYDIIYIPENDWLYVFKPGTDVRSAIEGTYLYDGDHDNDWIKWNGQRVQIKDLWDLLDKIKLSISKEEENALIAELSDIYFDDDKHNAINKVNYQ